MSTSEAALTAHKDTAAVPGADAHLGAVPADGALPVAVAVAAEHDLLVALEARLAHEVADLVGALHQFSRRAQAIGEELPLNSEFGKPVTVLLSSMCLQLAYALSKDADLPLLLDGGRAYLQKVGLSGSEFFAEFTRNGRRYVGVAHPDEVAAHVQRRTNAGDRARN